tara:strand:+ start:786 stop:1466 length:681 start_codon:yes stop_codon:yes gene_type:complete
MNWDDVGFLLSKTRYNENSVIAEIFTKDHGKISGLIFGGTSKKIKNYLQIGNLLHVNFNVKSENRIGYFKIEILQAYAPKYFEDHQKLSCISSAMNLIKIFTAESQTNIRIYNLLEKYFSLISFDEWIKEYIFWELELLKILGYDLELNEFVNKKNVNNEIVYVTKNINNMKIVPNFLINRDESVIDLKILINGLKLVGDFMDKNILKPNNLNHPLSRNYFISSIK